MGEGLQRAAAAARATQMPTPEEAAEAVKFNSYSIHDRVGRLERIVNILARALQVKGALELEEVQRELATLQSPPAEFLTGMSEAK